ncbi:MAG TPA: SGNH/GDSL hydrolase family protein, partial [Fibrobacteria bacterium]|nr:SGNH/GDSL hydrolase family protein [Fibrobacteria bacterium]
MKVLHLLAAGILIGVVAAFAPARAPSRLFLVGDSTVMTYKNSDAPMTGWGQRIGWFFAEGTVTVINRAIGGRSSRSFIEEGRWNTVRDELVAGDFLFIQFGHNDRSTVAERHADTA